MFNTFLAKEYHLKQARNQPNVMQAILDGIDRCLGNIFLLNWAFQCDHKQLFF